LGKQGEAVTARDLFASQFGIIKDFRDVLLHYDEYAVGGGQRRNLMVNADEGATVTLDDDGCILFAWGGHHAQLLTCARAALDLSRTLTELHWLSSLRP
jgi:hypothetical protein